MKMVQRAIEIPALMAKVAPKRIIHFPTLQTVLMIEDFLYKNRHGLGTRYQIWKRLPQKVLYQTYLFVLAYLAYSGKIVFDRKGNVAWVWNPEEVRKYLRQRDLIWKPKKKD